MGGWLDIENPKFCITFFCSESNNNKIMGHNPIFFYVCSCLSCAYEEGATDDNLGRKIISVTVMIKKSKEKHFFFDDIR